MRPVKIADSTVLSLVGNVVFHHNGAIITCDSAIRYSDRLMECFDNVIINKDSTYIYGDRADYDGFSNVARVFSPLVKLVDNDVVMYSYDLEFNTLTKVGTYLQGGTISQQDNLMESERAAYYVDERRVVFADSVAMRNDDYTIETDSMGYNFDTEITDFYRSAKIWNRDGDFLSADRGSYRRLEDVYIFTDNSYVLTENQQMWADSITYRKGEEFSFLYRNIQILEESRRMLSFGDYGIYDGLEQSALLTDNPSLIGYEENEAGERDSVFMRADSIFLFSFPLDTAGVATAGDSLAMDSVVRTMTDRMEEEADSSAADAGGREAIFQPRMDRERSDRGGRTEREVRPAPLSGSEDSGTEPVVSGEKKTEAEAPRPKTKRELRRERRLEKRRQKMRQYEEEHRDEIETAAPADTVAVDSALLTPLPAPAVDTTERDSMQRIVRAYRNVKIFRRDFQAVCDSLVGFSLDSTMHMYIGPVLWSDSSQVVSDVIHIYSRNGQLYRADFDGAPLMSEQVNDSLFNQVAGKLMYAFFRNNDIYRLDVNGNAQTYYYLRESGSQDIGGFLVAESAEITFTFDSSRVENIIYRGTPSYTIYPMDKIPGTQSQTLKGFVWKGDLRPAGREAVFDRSIRPSRREESRAIPRPGFGITREIDAERERLIRENLWRDRNDRLWIRPSDFQQRPEAGT